MNSYVRTAVVVSLVLVAGCLGGPATGPATSPESTESPTATSSPLPQQQVDLPTGPMEAPDPPAAFNESSVREYVRTYEYRYVYNALWYGENTEVGLTCDVGSVEDIGVGWRVEVTCSGYSNTQGEASGNETATVLHADWGSRTFVYYVDDDSVVRTSND